MLEGDTDAIFGTWHLAVWIREQCFTLVVGLWVCENRYSSVAEIHPCFFRLMMTFVLFRKCKRHFLSMSHCVYALDMIVSWRSIVRIQCRVWPSLLSTLSFSRPFPQAVVIGDASISTLYVLLDMQRSVHSNSALLTVGRHVVRARLSSSVRVGNMCTCTMYGPRKYENMLASN